MTMNLLPLGFRKKMTRRRILRRWLVVWILCVVAGSSASLASWVGLAHVQSEFKRLEAEASPLRKLRSENVRLTQEIDAIQRRESILEDVNGIDQPLNFLALISQIAQSTNDNLLIHRLTITEAEEAIKKTKSTGRKAPVAQQQLTAKRFIQVQLSGIATDDSAVATFVTGLRESEAFRSVELKSSATLPLPHGNGRQYEVVCRR